jgi:hypothetical protein
MPSNGTVKIISQRSLKRARRETLRKKTTTITMTRRIWKKKMKTTFQKEALL